MNTPTYSITDIELLLSIIESDQVTDNNIQEHIERWREMEKTILAENHLYSIKELRQAALLISKINIKIWASVDSLIQSIS